MAGADDAPDFRVARLSAVVHALIHAYMLLLPALARSIAARFEVSVLTVDAVGTAHYLAFGLGAIPAGLLADRYGSRALLVVCVTGCAASAALVAAAPTFPLFAVGLVALGASASIYHPSGLSLISRSTPPTALGRAIGIHGVGGSLGEALAPAAAALLATLVLGWRTPFLLAAVSAALLLIPLSHLPGDGLNFLTSGVAAPEKVKKLRPSPKLALVLGAALAGGLVYRGATYFLPRHLTERVGAGTLEGDALGSLLTSAALFAGVAGQWWGGRLADRFKRQHLFVTLTAVVLPLVLLLAALRGTPLAGAALVFGFAWYLGQPLLNSIAAGFVPREAHGTLYGVLFSTSFGLGSFAVWAGSAIADRWGTGTAFFALAGVAAGNLLLALTLARVMRRG